VAAEALAAVAVVDRAAVARVEGKAVAAIGSSLEPARARMRSPALLRSQPPRSARPPALRSFRRVHCLSHNLRRPVSSQGGAYGHTAWSRSPAQNAVRFTLR
jgi:hypothetical protein